MCIRDRGICANKTCYTFGSVFVGYKAGCTNDSTGNNVFVGMCAALTSTTAYQNTAVGMMAGCSLTSGRCNTMIGICAGRNHSSGNNSIYIGSRSCTLTGAASNEIVIGASVAGCGSNTLRLGTTSLTSIRAAVTTISSTSDIRDKCDIQPVSYTHLTLPTKRIV